MEYPFKDLMPLDEATARDGYYKDWTHIDADTFHQISELVKFIREKGRGADTREAIAQALERVYHDAAISGNANMEVSQARGSYPTLAERLNETDSKQRQTTAQLAEKVGGGKKAELEDLSPNVLSAIEGGEGTSFDLLSIPQNKSVTPEKTTFIETGTNMYDVSRAMRGKLISIDGAIVNNLDYLASDFIKVIPSSDYFLKGVASLAQYDANKRFLRRIDVSGPSTNYERLLTNNTDAHYWRLNVIMSSGVYMNKDSDKGFEEYFSKLSDTISIDGASIENDSVPQSAITGKTESAKRTVLGERATIIYASPFKKPNIDTVNHKLQFFGLTFLYYRKERYQLATSSSAITEVDYSAHWNTSGRSVIIYFDVVTKKFVIVPSEGPQITPENGVFVCTLVKNPEKNNELISVDADFEYTVNGEERYVSKKYLDDILSSVSSKPYHFVPESLDGFVEMPENTYVINNLNTAEKLKSAYTTLVSENSDYMTMEILGKDQSETYDVYKINMKPKQLSANYLSKKIPKIAFTTGVHGGEKGSIYATYFLAKALCEDWKSNKLLEYLRFNVEIEFIALASPWAFENVTGETFYGRLNVNGVDPNRNMPYKWRSGTFGLSNYGGVSAVSEKETQYIKALIDANADSAFYFDYHTNGSSGSDWSKCLYIDLGGEELHNESIVSVGNYWIQKMSREIVRKYDLTPDKEHLGFIYREPSQGKIAEYALSLGMISTTLETWMKFPTENTSYSPTTLKASAESLANFMIMMLREIKGS